MLRIAIQSSGRIKSETLELLERVGVKISHFGDTTFIAKSSDFPAVVYFVDNHNAPCWTMEGLVDVCICCQFALNINDIDEKNIIRRLGYDKTTLSFLVPAETKYEGVKWFNGRSIATPYPELVNQFLKKNALKATVRHMNEQAYQSVNVGIADAVFDRIYSGTSLFNGHLREAEKYLTSEAVMVLSPKITPAKSLILDELLSRIDSVIASRNKKFVSMNVPADKIDRICELVPSLCSQNITNSLDPKWVTISTVMDDTRLWDIVEKLRMLGVREIIACPIDNLIV